jgi:putative transposase
MPQSLANVALHLIFSTKDRAQMIPREVQLELNQYLGGILRNLDCPAIIVQSLTDHVHILFSLSRKKTISEVVKEVMTGSSKWIKGKGPGFRIFSWQRGYGIFSVSQSSIEAVRSYIERQYEHHRQILFQEELLKFLKKNHLQYDERYLWD